MQSKIDENAADVSQMVLAAKNGDWGTVYKIAWSKPSIINSIPEDRTWAALHQAVYWNNEYAVINLLNIPTCDALVKTKPNNEDPVGGKTPSQIAQSYQHEFIKYIIDDNVARFRNKRFSKNIPYKITASAGEKMNREGLPLLLNTLYSYKVTFHPSDVMPHNNFHEVIGKIAEFEHQGNHWLHARDKIALSLHAFAQDAGQHLSEKTTEDEFYDEIIRMYTRNNIYGAANKALNREGKGNFYAPTGDDLALGPYVLMLDVLLFFWNRLNQHSGVAYRGVGMWRSDVIAKYPVGNKFIWLQFVSASKLETVARGFGLSHPKGNHYVIFVIDNSVSSWWRPRDISSHSEYGQAEAEVLYPAGAEFEVTSTNYTPQSAGNYTTVNLRLVEPPN